MIPKAFVLYASRKLNHPVLIALKFGQGEVGQRSRMVYRLQLRHHSPKYLTTVRCNRHLPSMFHPLQTRHYLMTTTGLH